MDIIWCTGTSIPNRGRSFGPPNLRVYLGIPCRKGGINPHFSTALKTLSYFAKNTRDLQSSEKVRAEPLRRPELIPLIDCRATLQFTKAANRQHFGSHRRD